MAKKKVYYYVGTKREIMEGDFDHDKVMNKREMIREYGSLPEMKRTHGKRYVQRLTVKKFNEGYQGRHKNSMGNYLVPFGVNKKPILPRIFG